MKEGYRRYVAHLKYSCIVGVKIEGNPFLFIIFIRLTGSEETHDVLARVYIIIKYATGCLQVGADSDISYGGSSKE